MRNLPEPDDEILADSVNKGKSGPTVVCVLPAHTLLDTFTRTRVQNILKTKGCPHIEQFTGM